jgi:hypothetical protein
MSPPRHAATPAAPHREGQPTQSEPGEGLHQRIVAGADTIERLAMLEGAARARGDRLGLRLIAERKRTAYRRLQRSRRVRLVDLADGAARRGSKVAAGGAKGPGCGVTVPRASA